MNWMFFLVTIIASFGLTFVLAGRSSLRDNPVMLWGFSGFLGLMLGALLMGTVALIELLVYHL